MGDRASPTFLLSYHAVLQKHLFVNQISRRIVFVPLANATRRRCKPCNIANSLRNNFCGFVDCSYQQKWSNGVMIDFFPNFARRCTIEIEKYSLMDIPSYFGCRSTPVFALFLKRLNFHFLLRLHYIYKSTIVKIHP